MAVDPKRIQAVFLEALGHEDVDGRNALLDRECAADAELRRGVEALLGAHDQPDTMHDQTMAPPGQNAPPAGATLDATPSSPNSQSIPTIDGYDLLGELGRGGMGVVYRARHRRLNRPCALKMILAGAHANAEATARFRAEAEVVARLQHPNVVQIHHVDETGGLPFFELEYVDGGSLDRRLDGTPWPARRAAELVETLARAVAEAHRLGIIHRDLKPANVLLAADGTPKITDFGLAKSLESNSGLTRTDSIMGSPGYMAPEQAEGKAREVGPLADVYALGAILYELLTGRPPFRGTTVLETLEQVRTAEPVPPSRLVPGLPRDIVTIALKCLQKEPAKRYESAAALADDLRRFLDGRAIVARPVGPLELAWRWCRRHPAPAGLSAAVVLVAALGLAGILWQWREAVRARDLASRRAAAEARARREAEATLVDMYTISGLQAGEQGDHARAALWFANAARRASADPGRRQANATRAQNWGRQAFRPLHALVAAESWPAELTFHPHGQYLITANIVNGNDRLRAHALWDLESEQAVPFPGGAKVVRAAAWSPDGKFLAAGLEDGEVVVAGFPSGESETRIPFAPNLRRLLYSADGRYLAIAGGMSARVWDVLERRFATPELVHPAKVTMLAFHPEGGFLATGCLDQQARVFAVPGSDGSPSWPPVPHVQLPGTAWYHEFAAPPLFVNGGQELVTYNHDKGELTWRAVETGAEVRRRPVRDWTRGLGTALLSPDRRQLAMFGVMLPARGRLVEAATGRDLEAAPKHQNTILGAAFSPDGRMLATSSTDNTVRLWSVPDGKPLAGPLDLHRPAQLVAFAPDGRALATQDSGLVRVWSLPQEVGSMTRLALDGVDSLVAISPDGTLLLPTGLCYSPTLRSTRVYRLATGEPAGPTLRASERIVDAVFAPNGPLVALLGGGSDAPELVVRDWSNGRQEWRAALPALPRSVAYRGDGQRLAVLCGDGQLLLFDATSQGELRRWAAHEAEPAHHWINNGKVGFSPDGRSVLTWGMGHDLRVWDPETGRLRYPELHHRDKCHDVEFSPDGRLMALTSYDGSVRVREFATGAVVVALPDHPDMVYTARFSRDGRYLVTACRDRAVRVWDWRPGRLVCPPFEHAKDAVAATFTPDGRWVLSTSADATVRAWDWRTGKPVAPPMQVPGSPVPVPLSLAVSPDGAYAVIGGGDAAPAVLDLRALAPAEVGSDELVRQAELAAGLRLHEGGGTVNLTAGEWLDRWRAARR
jgi:WD40 repeat protein/tRNA A-37 threonylcarbamoyl transferase component Bud32